MLNREIRVGNGKLLILRGGGIERLRRRLSKGVAHEIVVRDIDIREWLLTNGLGSFASGTVCDARTRTYHGWLIAALEPPGRRTLLLSHIDASLDVANRIWALSTNFWNGGTKIEPKSYQLLRSFEIEPVPQWIWGSDDWQLSRRLVMPYGLIGNSQHAMATGHWCNRIMVHYQYQGTQVATLRLRPLIAERDSHHHHLADEGIQFSQIVAENTIYLQSVCNDQAGTSWQLRWSAGNYQPEGVWYWNYYYPEENRRGLSDREDLYSPGYLSVRLYPGDAVTLEASVRSPETSVPPGDTPTKLSAAPFEQAVQAEQQRYHHLEALIPQSVEGERHKIWHQLLQAGDQFIAYRASIKGPTAIAGYPWSSDWGRDTLMALPGLALATGRWDIARGLLATFSSYCQDGLIPNTFPDANTEPVYNSLDASLWWIETLGLYLETTQDWDFLIKQYSVVREIYKALTIGTLYNIGVDADDGLLCWDAPNQALTWMDVVIDGKPVTPRCGKPIEINALWYSALCWIGKWTDKMVRGVIKDRVRLMHHAQHYTQQAQKVKKSLQKFWNPERGYYYDTIEPDDHRNAQIRPNAVIALSLYHCGFEPHHARRVLQVARDRLLTPYGLRSLDWADPDYRGRVEGDHLHQSQAYHQGAVWSWLIGAFIRAWKRFYPTEPLPFDGNLLLEHFQQDACIGSVSEIFDGDPPHTARGAIAQACAVAELIRHFHDI